MTAELLEEWAKNVYEKRSGALFQQPNLLIMDSATCHNKDVITRISKRCQVPVILMTLYYSRRHVEIEITRRLAQVVDNLCGRGSCK